MGSKIDRYGSEIGRCGSQIDPYGFKKDPCGSQIHSYRSKINRHGSEIHLFGSQNGPVGLEISPDGSENNQPGAPRDAAVKEARATLSTSLDKLARNLGLTPGVTGRGLGSGSRP